MKMSLPSNREFLRKFLKLVKDNQAPISEIILVLDKHDLSMEDGQSLLLYIAGMSLGSMQIPLTDEAVVGPLSVSWQLGVVMEGEDPF
jgi:hypothetical protein